jgi:hypothetical protein
VRSCAGAGALDDDLVCGICQPVQCGVAADRVVEEAEPFVDAAIAGKGEATATVALDDQLVEILALLSGQSAKPEVIQDKKIRCQEAAERFLEGMVDARPRRAP